jgi:hypothetical protein
MQWGDDTTLPSRGQCQDRASEHRLGFEVGISFPLLPRQRALERKYRVIRAKRRHQIHQTVGLSVVVDLVQCNAGFARQIYQRQRVAKAYRMLAQVFDRFRFRNGAGARRGAK